MVHKHEGHLQARIVYYLMNIHITPRTIYLTRVSHLNSRSRTTLITPAMLIDYSGLLAVFVQPTGGYRAGLSVGRGSSFIAPRCVFVSETVALHVTGL